MATKEMSIAPPIFNRDIKNFAQISTIARTIILHPHFGGSGVFSKTVMSFSEYGYRPHVVGVFRHRKQRFSNTLSRVETYRIRTEVLKYDDMPRL